MTAFKTLLALRAAAQAEGIPTLRDKTFSRLIKEVRARGAERILEIGAAVGISGAAMLLAAENARLVTVEKRAEYADRARETFRALSLDGRAEVLEGDADEIVPLLSGGYDFILLDGPKGKYLSYLPHLKALLKTGGALFADNVSLREYGLKHTERRNRTAKRNMEAFCAAVLSDGDFSAQRYEEEDGVLLAEKIR